MQPCQQAGQATRQEQDDENDQQAEDQFLEPGKADERLRCGGDDDGPDDGARKAAEAAECARLQNPTAFWDFARYFYTKQGSINVKNIQDNVDKLAKQTKLDAPSLKACMDSPQTAARIKQDQSDGNTIHVSSTPTFFVNGIPVIGLPDNKVLEYVINSELAGKGPAAAATNK